MSAEGLSDFARKSVWPVIEKQCDGVSDFRNDAFYLIGIEEKQPELEGNPNQIHMHLRWEYDNLKNFQKQINFRIGLRGKEKVITIYANPNQLRPSVVSVNGDESWRDQLANELNIFLRHPEFCTIEEIMDD